MKAIVRALAVISGVTLGCSGTSDGTSAEDLANHSVVRVWITSHPDDAFSHHTDAENADRGFGAVSPSSAKLEVDDTPALRRQRVLGFGAALTDASAWILWNELSTDERNDLLDDLMSQTKGIGLGLLRLPIAASDSTRNGRYSYDDGSADPTLSRFSIHHDKEYILPILRHVLEKVNADVRIIATPWSPPGWMKTDGSMIGGSLKSEYHATYADYLVKFVRAYWENGVPIYALTPQNEPGQAANYPSMSLPEPEEAALVTNHIRPALDAAHFGWVNLLGFDHNWGDSYPVDLLADASARKALTGTAFHCYGGDHSAAMTALHALHPDKDVLLTECDRAEKPDGQNNDPDEGIQRLIRAMNNWSRSYMAWQLVLHPDGTPNQGSGCMHEDAEGHVVWHCVGVVSVKDHKVKHGWDYAYLGHASKFVRRNAEVVHVDALPLLGIEAVAFVNPDGGRVLVAFNASGVERTMQVVWHGLAFDASMPARSAATYVW